MRQLANDPFCLFEISHPCNIQNELKNVSGACSYFANGNSELGFRGAE
jgi:hypothetical protein